MINAHCEEPEVAETARLDIRCQMFGPKQRCRHWAVGYAMFDALEVNLAVCEQHCTGLRGRQGVRLVTPNQKGASDLYKEARRWDEYLVERSKDDPPRAVCWDEDPVPSPSDKLPPSGCG